jgi:hypothetical protein
MSAIVKLSYHRATLELWGREPVLNKDVQRRLKQWEKGHPNRLPLSVREWLLLRDACPVLFGGSHNEGVVGLEDFLCAYVALSERARTGERKLLCFYDVHQGVTYYHLEIDGSEDPLVVVLDCGHEDDELPRERFSTFLFSSAWPGLPGGCYSLVANDTAFGPMELDYLIENYREGPRSGVRDGATWYRFFNATGRISVTRQGEATREGRAHWGLMASSEESLYTLAKHVWRCGTLSRRLRGSRKVEKEVVKRLRTEFQSS